ncbi:DUF4421 family protein [Panacibacter sp. DH6]|uniref:DUF4421 family protein n=1 Tax=Panacibacter microcysteis TaxID=2793269 RepID=A0A931E9J3_9BACT|nr:DUF4421 family protein [Panacibacter microcysteis]MBG9376186.1 DUF4421 family protein [Panacibacter microcysteis]
MKIYVYGKGLIALGMLFFSLNIFAQYKPQHDTGYYTTFPKKLTTRFYFSKKYTSVHFPAAEQSNDIDYRANTPLVMGVGATYNNLSLNLAYGFGFINHDDEKGKTKSIDLELHVYPYKWAIDVLAIRHKGLHIDKDDFAQGNNQYYYRADAVQTLAGIAAYRVPNAGKFSYNAAMIQSEWQKKSAGSVLYGGEFYYGAMKGDSSLIPAAKAASFTQAPMDKMQFFTVGIGAGYAYTLVIQKHLYIMGSGIANLDVHFSSAFANGVTAAKTAVAPSFIYKAAIGYNWKDWNLSANLAANTLWINTATADRAYVVPTGNYRFILAKRIDVRRK